MNHSPKGVSNSKIFLKQSKPVGNTHQKEYTTLKNTHVKQMAKSIGHSTMKRCQKAVSIVNRCQKVLTTVKHMSKKIKHSKIDIKKHWAFESRHREYAARFEKCFRGVALSEFHFRSCTFQGAFSKAGAPRPSEVVGRPSLLGSAAGDRRIGIEICILR